MSEEKFTRRNVKRRLLEIQEQAAQLQTTAAAALKDIASLEKIRIFRWRCVYCGYVTAFSKPQAVEACGPCGQCKLTRWVPDGEKPLSD